MNPLTFLFWYFPSRIYKEQGGDIYVKEAFSLKWERLSEHLLDKHPELQDAIIESTRKVIDHATKPTL